MLEVKDVVFLIGRIAIGQIDVHAALTADDGGVVPLLGEATFVVGGKVHPPAFFPLDDKTVQMLGKVVDHFQVGGVQGLDAVHIEIVEIEIRSEVFGRIGPYAVFPFEHGGIAAQAEAVHPWEEVSVNFDFLRFGGVQLESNIPSAHYGRFRPAPDLCHQGDAAKYQCGGGEYDFLHTT